MTDELHCRNCGALLSADAEWCGLCLQPVKAPEPEAQLEPKSQPGSEPESATELESSPGLPPSAVPIRQDPPSAPTDPEPASHPSDEADGDVVDAFWACPVCGEEVPMDLNLCPICGTPFARLFEDSGSGPRVPPDTAARLGLLPGLGHLRAGRAGDGIARMFTFGMSLAFLLIFLTSSQGRWSLLITALYIVFCSVLVAESYLDAGRAAAGERELISGRNLLWVSVAVLAVSVGLVVMLSIGVQPGGQ